MVCIISDGDIFEASLSFSHCSSFLLLVVSDHPSKDPAVTPFYATGHLLVTLWRSICAEDKAQTVEPLMSSKYCRRIIHACFLVCAHCLLDCSQD